jgi:hypothetical protein
MCRRPRFLLPATEYTREHGRGVGGRELPRLRLHPMSSRCEHEVMPEAMARPNRGPDGPCLDRRRSGRTLASSVASLATSRSGRRSSGQVLGDGTGAPAHEGVKHRRGKPGEPSSTIKPTARPACPHRWGRPPAAPYAGDGQCCLGTPSCSVRGTWPRCSCSAYPFTLGRRPPRPLKLQDAFRLRQNL